jgi:phage gp29-like protein
MKMLFILGLGLLATTLTINQFALQHTNIQFSPYTFEEAQATGGADTIKNLIDPILDRAIDALEQNNSEVALEELQTVRDELDDTFEADQNE